MDVGAAREVTTGDCTDLYCVETGMFETTEYGAVYVLDDERPAIVETGIGTTHDAVLDGIESTGVGRDDVEVIAVTHVHLDHAGGAGLLAEACPNADVYVHEIGAPHLADPERLVTGTKQAVGDEWAHYVEPEPVPEERLVSIGEGDAIDLGRHELVVHETPGHAPHQFVFEDSANDAVFTGDAAGIWIPSIERIRETSPPAQFTLQGCLDDLETIRELDPSVLLYTHFGPRELDDVAATLETYGDVLSEWVERVETTRAKHGDDGAAIESLAEDVDPAIVDTWGERKAQAETAMNVRGVLGYLDWNEQNT